jgi:serine/threonine-protein kinase
MVTVGDRYELGDLVGAGGMARVMEARDLVLERDVAVKLLRDDIARDDGARQRFLREARTAAQLNHPNAVAVFDSGEDGGDPWIVMELVQGEDLAQRIRRAGPLDEPEALRVADAVLAALAAAHRDGFIHRDIKPSNIMLLDDGSVKLADFGIAKSVQDSSGLTTDTGALIGTARYLSPEQVNGASATPASDVYAMGIVLYEMLVGAAPFTGTEPLAVAVAHTREPVPDVADAAPHVSAGLAAVIGRALAKDPVDRFADAGQVRAALGAVVDPAASATTQILPTAGATLPLVDDDAPTLESIGPPPAAPPPARGPRRSRSWLLVTAAAVGLTALVAVVGMQGGEAPEPAAETEPTAEAEAPDTTTDARPPAGAAELRDRDAGGGGASNNGKAKGDKPDKSKGKAKGKDR